jgi:muramoyltetrapeptide carboxypeptidase
MPSRRNFIKTGILATSLLPFSANAKGESGEYPAKLIKPPAIKFGDTFGLITPASPLHETHRLLIEAKEKMEGLGFKVKFGKNVFAKKGYLAGSVKERLDDIHDMFQDKDVQAIITLRGGYGSGQLLPYLDYNLIAKHPKILIGYSDITFLINAIYKKTGLVTYHGPVALSTFTDYTKKYFLKTLMETEPVGEIEDAPYEENFQTTNRIWPFRKGTAEGKLIGGNLTLLQSSLGTPFEFETKDSILFIEEVGERPYDLDRMLNQFKQAGKFDQCRGVIFDKMEKVLPDSDGPGYDDSLTVEEVIEAVFKDFDFPVSLGFSIGHLKDKPTLPLGIKARFDADLGKLSLLEAAVS